jgi:hypothetical protein
MNYDYTTLKAYSVLGFIDLALCNYFKKPKSKFENQIVNLQIEV